MRLIAQGLGPSLRNVTGFSRKTRMANASFGGNLSGPRPSTCGRQNARREPMQHASLALAFGSPERSNGLFLDQHPVPETRYEKRSFRHASAGRMPSQDFFLR